VTSGLIIAHFSDAKIITCSPASTFISKTTMKTFTLKKNLLELTFANEQLDVVSTRVFTRSQSYDRELQRQRCKNL
jgi:hypothetical protein